MKRIATIVSLMAAAMMFSVLSIRADEGAMGGGYGGERMEKAQKDECLLVAKNCGNDMDSYQERISRLQNEIAKGTAVYTDEELSTLRDALEREIREFAILRAGHAL